MNIGVLNSGGDSPGLNAVIEGVVGAASRRGWNVVGFYDGFEGLLSEEGDERFEWLTPAACRGLRAKGGTSGNREQRKLRHQSRRGPKGGD